MSGAVVLPLGRSTLAWVRQGGPPTRAGWTLRFMLRWQGLWFERNLSLQRSLCTARSLPEDPLFILGLWRSGTTYLHDLLGAGPGMICPSTWQCMNPAFFRLRPHPAAGRLVRRPMDGFSIDAHSAQEDEFALLALGGPSVYRGFLDPRRLPELTRWLDPEVWSREAHETWLPPWRDFLAGVTEGGPGRLLLKSPPHTFRIRALMEIFPRATYVWLVRDPVETFLSNRKMWLAMFQRYALWHWDAGVLDEFLCQAFAFAAESLRQATALLPKERLVVVSFDELTDSTLPTMERLYRRLALGDWTQGQAAIGRIAAAKSGYRRDRYDSPELPVGARKAIEELGSLQKSALKSHGSGGGY